VVASAPRYDPRLLEALGRLDDRNVPIAEVARRVGSVAAALGLPRPSYVHLRRLVLVERDREDAERARREDLRDLVDESARRLVVGLAVNPYVVADRVADVERRYPR
jgi:hypothetical protein